MQIKCSNKDVIFEIDDEDVSRVLEHTKYWNLTYRGYIIGSSKILKKNIYIHRIVLNYFGELEVHHLDGNKLNNHKSNLFLVSKREHSKIHKEKKDENKLSPNLSGAYWHKCSRSWMSLIQINGKRIHGGYFKTEEEAAEKSKKLYEEYDKLN